jgi:hypothetical protein
MDVPALSSPSTRRSASLPKAIAVRGPWASQRTLLPSGLGMAVPSDALRLVAPDPQLLTQTLRLASRSHANCAIVK